MIEARQERQRGLLNDPELKRLVRLRQRVSWAMALLAAAALIGLIAAMTWVPELLGRGAASAAYLTPAVLAALGIIVLCLILTGAYLIIHNRIFEPAERRILQRLEAHD